jgi:hypothetical protein
VALENAANDLRNDETITIEPVIDRDTLGLAGSPDISQSIFSKIEAASVFVCDVTIIDPKSKKPSPNPNVLLELGYAIKVLGWERIVMVMNTEFGNPTILPFDLRARRVTTYAIAKDTVEKAPARNSLKKTLVAALKLIFEGHGSQSGKSVMTDSSDSSATDRQLLKEFMQSLPSDGSINFIDNQNMAGFSWPRDRLNELYTFYNEWGDAEHEFLDNEIEQIRSKLYNLIGGYLGQIATNTFPANDPAYQTVPPEWEERNPKKFFEVVNKLHETAGAIVNAHQDLIRISRKKLGATDL